MTRSSDIVMPLGFLAGIPACKNPMIPRSGRFYKNRYALIHRIQACFIVLPLILFTTACEKQPESEMDVSVLLGGDSVEGYQRAIQPRNFSFPSDHGEHPGFRNEWWYLTGNLQDGDGHAFGYQVTFFRIALSPHGVRRVSSWASNQVWMAHVALSDIDARRHYHDQRFARGAVGLAGVEKNPLRIWLEDWTVFSSEENGFPWTLDVATENFSLNLTLDPKKPPVLQGKDGLSQKSSEPGNASYYYSMTRIESHGSIRRGDKAFDVTGQSWLDREWSTSALSSTQAGWDWFSLQLDDGRDLMFYRIRDKSGRTDPHSAGSLVGESGDVMTLSEEGITLDVLKTWRSPTGKNYPVEWRMTVHDEPESWIIRPAFEDQEMQTAVHYWEGAIKVSAEKTGKPLGQGYLEMTGY